MPFELRITADTDFLAALAAATGRPPEHGKLVLPAALGTGYIQEINCGPRLRLIVCQCELNQEVQFRKTAFATGPGQDALIFSFRNLSPPGPPRAPQLGAAARHPAALPAVRVASADMDFAFCAPAHTPINSLLIGADATLFRDLLTPGQVNGVVQQQLAGGQAFLYEEIISPPMQAVAAQLVAAEAPAERRRYYQKLKAEELVYLFLAELLKRRHAPVYPLSVADARQLDQVRDKLLADLSTPPSLPALAGLAGLSESKLKRLFKQVFGTSIYTY